MITPGTPLSFSAPTLASELSTWIEKQIDAAFVRREAASGLYYVEGYMDMAAAASWLYDALRGQYANSASTEAGDAR